MDRLGLRLLGAAPKDICKEGIRKLNETDNTQELIDFYKKNIDFCLDNNFPTTDILLSDGRDFAKRNGIFIDENRFLANIPFLVALGGSELDVNFSGVQVSQVYAKNNSKIILNAKDNAYVTVDIFNEVQMTAEVSGEAKVLVNVYGNAKVEATGNVKIVKKNREKY
ncbi:hypothetical protein [Pedobacter sp.]